MNSPVEFDALAAVQMAARLDSEGKTSAAALMWQRIFWSTPCDRESREKLGDLLFDTFQHRASLGSVARSRLILEVIGRSFPTKKLRQAYFENLHQLLQTRAKRTRPAAVVLAIGTGRCGSTTLSAAVSRIPDACATHENPPLIYWEPLEEQEQFHIDRLRLLADYYSPVFDASHWWLNVLDRVFAEFPDAKVIGLYRETESCVRSFLKVKGTGRDSSNHWAPAETSYWNKTLWDSTYPSYPLSADFMSDPDAAKEALIHRYVTQYNQALRSLFEAFPKRIFLIRSEDLNDPTTTTQLSAILGAPLEMSRTALNVGNTFDSEKRLYRF